MDACVLVTEHGGLGHTSAIYATDEAAVDALLDGGAHRTHPGQRAHRGRRPRRRLQLPDADVLARLRHLGRVITTDNVNYRNLLNIKTVSRRRTPPQWFRVPSDTYFNAGALENLREIEPATAVIVTDAFNEQRGVVDDIRRHLAPRDVRVFADVSPSPTRPRSRAGVELLDASSPT